MVMMQGTSRTVQWVWLTPKVEKFVKAKVGMRHTHVLVACTMLTVAVREVWEELVTVAEMLELLARLLQNGVVGSFSLTIQRIEC